MTFGPNSGNPRERRAFAHATIENFKAGKAPYDQAFEAVLAAREGRKGKASSFPQALGNCAVLLVDNTSGREDGFEFGGTLFPPHLAAEVAAYESGSDDSLAMPQVDFADYPRVTFRQVTSITTPEYDISHGQVPVLNPAAMANISLTEVEYPPLT
jgi:hypothetical protein